MLRHHSGVKFQSLSHQIADSLPSPAAREFTRSDILKLLRAALCVLLRRDMSLNRRVYNWLEGHGAEEANETKRLVIGKIVLIG